MARNCNFDSKEDNDMNQSSTNKNYIRQTILGILARYKEEGAHPQAGSVLHEAMNLLKCGQGDNAAQQVLLTVWYDLFREGILSWGFNIQNSGPPFCHLTERGADVMGQLSRDPSNPAGYLANLETIGSLNALAISYIEEGLDAYNAGCHRASAVMVGCASECLALELRDTIVAKFQETNQSVAKKLQDWRAKTVMDQLASEITTRQISMPRKLWEEYSSYWAAFTGQIRMARNEGGHPNIIEPVTVDVVHASLLIFPQLAKLSVELLEWVRSWSSENQSHTAKMINTNIR